MSDLDDEELKATRILNRADTREHRVYAIKFAVMQKQIDEKDKRIKELEKNQKQMCEEYCPKSNKIKDEEIEFQKDINRIEKDRHKKTEKSLKGQIIKNNKIIEKLEKENEELLEVKVSASAHNRILELEKENEELNKLHIQDNKHLNFIMKHSISIQKIKDKIEKEIKYHERNILDIENITMLKSKTDKEEAEIEFNKYAIVVLKKMLQELLEGRK